MRRPIFGAVAWAAIAVSTVVGCGGGGDPTGPMVGRIDDALDAVESYYGEPQVYDEISATADLVEVIVEGADGAAQMFWEVDGGLTVPHALDAPDRPTFERAAIDFDPDTILGALRDQLPDSEIVDFAVTGAGDGAVVYDARVRSERGGVLLVLLGRDGRILGAQAE